MRIAENLVTCEQCVGGDMDWIRKFHAKSDVDLSSGGNDQQPSDVTGFLEQIQVCDRTNDDKQKIFLIGWPLGHRDADITTQMQAVNVRYHGSRKHRAAARQLNHGC